VYSHPGGIPHFVRNDDKETFSTNCVVRAYTLVFLVDTAASPSQGGICILLIPLDAIGGTKGIPRAVDMVMFNTDHNGKQLQVEADIQ